MLPGRGTPRERGNLMRLELYFGSRSDDKSVIKECPPVSHDRVASFRMLITTACGSVGEDLKCNSGSCK